MPQKLTRGGTANEKLGCGVTHLDYSNLVLRFLYYAHTHVGVYIRKS